MKSNRIAAIVASVLVVATVSSCAPAATTTTTAGTTAAGTTAAGTTAAATTAAKADDKVSGSITIDGSSTVYPLTEAIIEIANKEFPKLQVAASASGSGTGLKRLTAGEIDIAGSSRKIKQEELDAAKAKGIEIIQLEVAIDGIAVVTNKKNPLKAITTEQLNKMWGKDSVVKDWKEVDPSFPDLPLTLFSPGAASGTFEYFTEKVNKKAKEQRSADVQTSEDDNVLVTGVTGNEGGLGYFGFTYFEENMDKLNALSIDGVEATKENIISFKYPLSRPLFLYVNKDAVAKKPEVKAFLNYYLDNAIKMANEIMMVPATDEIIKTSKELVK